MKSTYLALALISALLQEPGPWRVVFEQDKKLGSVREDGTDRREEPGPPPGFEVPSPDGKRLLYIEDSNEDEEIWVKDANGENRRKLSSRHEVDGLPAWTPDGKRVVFTAVRGGSCQVWIMDADGAHLTRLTTHEGGARNPKVSPRGDRIAYREIIASREKLPPSTVRLIDPAGGNSTAILERTQVLEFAWSPTGDRLACSLVGELRILDVPSGKTAHTFTFAEISKQLHAHAAYGVVWRPDGAALACTIHFLGGRMLGTKLYGDDQLFILPLKGKPVTVEMKGPAGPVRWIR